MNQCFDTGQLHSYLDGELTRAERAHMQTHIEGCTHCTTALAALRNQAAEVQALLAPAQAPDLQTALLRMRTTTAIPPAPQCMFPPPAEPRRSRMFSNSFATGRSRALIATVTALVVVLALLALPPVRAAADNLLSIFRVQKVVFVPIDQARLQQLGDLKLDKSALFVGKPTAPNSTPPRTVASAEAAAAATGHSVSAPATLPSAPTSTEYTVQNGGQVRFQINLATARQVLSALDIQDVTLPDQLGAGPIVVDVPTFVSTHYRGTNYDLTLRQSASPQVTLPDGVNLAELGRASLRVLGMTPEQAELMSRQINWSNTLLFPFPSDTNNIRQVTVGSDTGLLVTGGPRGTQHGVIYWQHGDTMYILEAHSSSAREQEIADLLLHTAESVQ